MDLLDEIVTIDFETKEIDGALPPVPVGVSIKYGAGPSKYYAWGHPTRNNADMMTVRAELIEAVKKPCLFHNAAFDIGVMEHQMGMYWPREIHDTLILAFLHDPHSKDLGLKSLADRLLGMPPEEQDLLKMWIMLHVPEAKPSTWGAYISRAPGDLVGEYACGDTDRTYGLFKMLYHKYRGPAYERERALIPILTQNTLEGIRIDELNLYKDYLTYTEVHNKVSQRIFTKLGVGEFNIDSADELVKAIDMSGTPAEWLLTPTGKRSTAKKNLAAAIKDEELITLLGYRGTLSTYLESFYNSWMEKTRKGTLYFSWNQVRNNETGGQMGTRTGRLSSKPSLLNVPKEVAAIDPKWLLPPLPNMRKYLLPDEGDEWLKRDYCSQELRILAHFEDGAMMKAFNDDPRLDLHQMMSEIISHVLGRSFSRRGAKTVAFSLLYGSGLDLLAAQLGSTMQEATESKNAYLKELQGIKTVQASIKYNWDRMIPIKTWGGREYFKEPGRIIKDKKRGGERYADFGYKGLNYLIQGSSADVTKQAIINYDYVKKDGRFMLSVHDEINISGPLSEHKILNEAMLDIKVDVPMMSDGSHGPNYGSLETYEYE